MKQGDPRILEFFEKSLELETDDCILWPYHKSEGYGRVYSGLHKWDYFYVHAEALKRKLGPCPPGLDAAHACHNRACFNYRHLSRKTRKGNVWDSIHMYRGENKGGHILTEEDVHNIRFWLWIVGDPVKEIAERCHVNTRTIHNIKQGLERGGWRWLPEEDYRSM